MSSAARVKACWSIMRSICAIAAALDSPAWPSPPSVWFNAASPSTMPSARCAWCNAARSAHSVVVIEVPMAPAMVRMKLDSPAAAAMRSGAMPDISSVVSGMKKNAIAAPCKKVGNMICTRSDWVLKAARRAITKANIKNDAVTIQRGSQTETLRPDSGVNRIASTPTGASAMPAEMAV